MSGKEERRRSEANKVLRLAIGTEEESLRETLMRAAKEAGADVRGDQVFNCLISEGEKGTALSLSKIGWTPPQLVSRSGSVSSKGDGVSPLLAAALAGKGNLARELISLGENPLDESWMKNPEASRRMVEAMAKAGTRSLLGILAEEMGGGTKSLTEAVAAIARDVKRRMSAEEWRDETRSVLERIRWKATRNYLGSEGVLKGLLKAGADAGVLDGESLAETAARLMRSSITAGSGAALAGTLSSVQTGRALLVKVWEKLEENALVLARNDALSFATAEYLFDALKKTDPERALGTATRMLSDEVSRAESGAANEHSSDWTEAVNGVILEKRRSFAARRREDYVSSMRVLLAELEKKALSAEANKSGEQKDARRPKL